MELLAEDRKKVSRIIAIHNEADIACVFWMDKSVQEEKFTNKKSTQASRNYYVAQLGARTRLRFNDYVIPQVPLVQGKGDLLMTSNILQFVANMPR